MGGEGEDRDPFVVVGRFDDPVEGWIAAGALEDQGLPVLYLGCGNGQASTNYIWRWACGGTHLWVPQSRLGEAHSFLAGIHPVDPAAIAWTKHPMALLGVPLAAVSLLDAYTAYLVAFAVRHPTRRRIAGTAMLLVFWVVMLVTIAVGIAGLSS